MKIGLQIPNFSWSGGTAKLADTLTEIAQAADENGFVSLWVMDHLFQIRGVGSPEEPMLEAYSALSYLAAVTKHVKLGALVTAAVYRHPGMLIKQVTTLDVLSRGRAILGIGAAWNEDESKALGLPFPPTAERFERLEEILQIALQMWSGDTRAFHGKHYQLENPINSPAALSQPRPEILIGGGGEKKTLKLVAKYADACNLFSMQGPEGVQHKLEVLKGYCDGLGRPYEEIAKTSYVVAPVDEQGKVDVDKFVGYARELAAVGIQTLTISVPHVELIEPLRVIGREVIPALAGF